MAVCPASAKCVDVSMVRLEGDLECIRFALARVSAIDSLTPENVADVVVSCRFSIGRAPLGDGPLFSGRSV